MEGSEETDTPVMTWENTSFPGFDTESFKLLPSHDENIISNSADNTDGIVVAGNVVHLSTDRKNQAAEESLSNSDFDLDFNRFLNEPFLDLITLAPPSLESSGAESSGSVGSVSSQVGEVAAEASPGGSSSSESSESKKPIRKRKRSELAPEKKLKENKRLQEYRKKKKEENERLTAENSKLKEENQDLTVEKTSWMKIFETLTNANDASNEQVLRLQEENEQLQAKIRGCFICSETLSAPAL